MSKNLPSLSPIETTYKELVVELLPTSALQNHPCTNQPRLVNVVAKGATTSINEAVNIIIDHIKGIVAHVEGMTIEQALDKCFLLLCMDRAEHDNTGKSKENVITYSLTLSSHTLMRYCGLYTSSGKNIFPFAQMHRKENLQTLKCLMQARLEEVLNGHELTNGCPVYHMADAKVLYLIFGHSGWASHKKPYLWCECNKGDSANADHM